MVALVRGLHGVAGAMRVEVLTDRPAERFVVGARLFPEGSPDPITVVEARPADPGWVLRFAEIPSREVAEAFRLVYLEVERGPGDALPRGAYYWHELIGVAVRDLDGVELGTVQEVYRAGGADVVEVAGGPRGAFDLPLARPFVRILAPRRGEIVADADALDLPPPGPPPALPAPRPPRPRRATRRRPAVPAPPENRADARRAVPAPPENRADARPGPDLPPEPRDAPAPVAEDSGPDPGA